MSQTGSFFAIVAVPVGAAWLVSVNGAKRGKTGFALRGLTFGSFAVTAVVCGSVLHSKRVPMPDW